MASTNNNVFTSDLSTSDFWLLMDKGWMPLGLVLGNSVYSMGVVGGLGSSLKGMAKGEVPQITELMYNARELALGRMKDEATKLGADGVVEVKLSVIPNPRLMVSSTGILGTTVCVLSMPSTFSLNL